LALETVISLQDEKIKKRIETEKKQINITAINTYTLTWKKVKDTIKVTFSLH
jgi:hypothetical protein